MAYILLCFAIVINILIFKMKNNIIARTTHILITYNILSFTTNLCLEKRKTRLKIGLTPILISQFIKINLQVYLDYEQF